MSLYFRICFASYVACLVLMAGSAAAQPAASDWQSAARTYLDDRMTAWLAWPQAREHGGGNTRCISCHTAVPMAMARPKLGGILTAEEAMLENIRQRVARWDEMVAFDGTSGDIRPFYVGSRTAASLATESVLNAFVLTHADSPGTGGTLSAPARRALDLMWSRQNAGGSWDWLNFNLRPWELDADYFGAAVAAIAVGRAGPAYYDHLMQADQARLNKLRAYLRDRYAQESLHNRLAALWASLSLDGILDDSQRQALKDEALALDPQGDGWTLTALARRPGNSATWPRVHAIPGNATYDGYATAYVLYVLKRAGATHAKLARAKDWLIAQQVAAGRGPVIYLNVARNPDSSDADEATEGKFMRDAAAAYAVLALSEGD
jgi:squalene-hopene/tetraprenyl-beta-curcumene cyclase